MNGIGPITRTCRRSMGLMCVVFLSFVLNPLAVLAQGNGGVVTGQIRLPDGSPAGGIRVSAMSADGGIADVGVLLESLAETDLSGRYRLTGISPGRYYIIAGTLDAPTYYPGADSARDARVLEIEDGATVGSVDFIVRQRPAASRRSARFRVPSGISGRVILEGGTGLPRFLPRLYVDAGKGNRRTAFGEDGNEIRGSRTFGAIAVSRDGSFRLLLDDGDYTISLITSLGVALTGADGYYVKSIVSGSVDLSKQTLPVRGRTAPAITITLAAAEPPAR